MATRIRLQRYGKKGKAYFHIVVADGRSKRDGKFIEKIGDYNPNTNPASIDIAFDRCLHWVQVGAEPSETCRAILSYKGVLMKDHLLRGVKKGALTEEQAEAKFNAWLEGKTGTIDKKKTTLAKSKEDINRARLAAEKEISAARAAAIAAASAEVATEAEAPAESEESTTHSEATEETAAQETAVTAEATEATEAAEAAETTESAETPEEENKEE